MLRQLNRRSVPCREALNTELPISKTYRLTVYYTWSNIGTENSRHCMHIFVQRFIYFYYCITACFKASIGWTICCKTSLRFLNFENGCLTDHVVERFIRSRGILSDNFLVRYDTSFFCRRDTGSQRTRWHRHSMNDKREFDAGGRCTAAWRMQSADREDSNNSHYPHFFIIILCHR